MKNNDLVQVAYTPEELEACKQGVTALETFANLHSPNLSADDRRTFGSINETHKLFVNKTVTLIEQNPIMLPSFIDHEEFKRDFKAREDIEKTLLRLDAITKNLTDTKILLDHDNYQDSLAFYRSVRYNAREQQHGALPVYNELKQFFPSRKTAKQPQEQD